MKLDKLFILGSTAIASTFATLAISTNINATPNRPFEQPL